MSCGVCLHDLTDARLLPCLHSFCRPCLDQLAVDVGPDGQVRCPTCRTPCHLPVDRGAAALPRDSTKAKGETDGTCEVCWREDGERRPASVWCGECEVGLCAGHITDHVLQPRHHRIEPCGVLPCGRLERPAVGREVHFQPCPEHGQPMMYFCKTCDTPIAVDVQPLESIGAAST